MVAYENPKPDVTLSPNGDVPDVPSTVMLM
jgi:hypothetical protein